MATVSVVICAHTDRRWAALGEAIASVQRQSPAPHEVLVVIDHNEDLLARVREAFPDVVAIPNEDERGLSGGRNTGIAHATGDVVAFLDDDAAAADGWVAAVVGALRDPAVAGVGGPVLPDYEVAPPGWLPEEYLWVVGCSYRGQPTGAATIRNPIGANMAFRRDVFDRVGGFTHALARNDSGRLVSCDETEFSIRVRQGIPGARVVNAPGMRVRHLVPAERVTWSYFRRRCFGEGFAKAIVTAEVGAGDGLSSERSYAARTLPSGVVLGVRDGLRGDPAGLRRAAAIVAGLGITAAGYARGQVAQRAGR